MRNGIDPKRIEKLEKKGLAELREEIDRSREKWIPQLANCTVVSCLTN